ncbi:MAG: HesA/MoeB/ThiF family protein [Clostridia bacterium]|nr:HesA/MoeB/ThiF family protein [Clostridia bacterium]
MNDRYARHRQIPGFGDAGQQALSSARVLVIGAGGLGSPAILYLAAAGVGRLAVADGDRVSPSNLQRQTLYTPADIGKNKAEAACAFIGRFNPEVQAVCLPERLDAGRLARLLPGFDCVLDCTDCLESKYLVNDLCTRLAKPFVHAGVSGMAGQLMCCPPGHACLRCALPEPGSSAAADAGVLGAAAGAIGALQAAEAVKLITGVGRPLADALLHIDAGAGEAHRIAVPKNPACPACGPKRHA